MPGRVNHLLLRPTNDAAAPRPAPAPRLGTRHTHPTRWLCRSLADTSFDGSPRPDDGGDTSLSRSSSAPGEAEGRVLAACRFIRQLFRCDSSSAAPRRGGGGDGGPVPLLELAAAGGGGWGAIRTHARLMEEYQLPATASGGIGAEGSGSTVGGNVGAEVDGHSSSLCLLGDVPALLAAAEETIETIEAARRKEAAAARRRRRTSFRKAAAYRYPTVKLIAAATAPVGATVAEEEEEEVVAQEEPMLCRASPTGLTVMEKAEAAVRGRKRARKVPTRLQD